MKIQSAGIVIVDFSGVVPTALCLLDDFHQWDFPKGHVEKGETLLQGAIRETEEESGLSVGDFRITGWSASTGTYKVPRGNKVATYFFAERTSNMQPYLPVNPHIGKPEHISLSWFPITQLYDKMPLRLVPVIDKMMDWVNSNGDDQVDPEDNEIDG